MLRFSVSTAALGVFSLPLLGHVVDADAELSCIYYDNREFLANASKALKISWPGVVGHLRACTGEQRKGRMCSRRRSG
ncbi:hypothetical protein LX36DRAFT_664109 [Colletotrichum falcatum]|nr:hypothetical protein LX36DRAFT_664109 [Colletotrichum falcatum]